MKSGTDSSAIPAKLSLHDLAKVTAGLAKLVDDVNKYALPIQSETSSGIFSSFNNANAEKIMKTKPAVATTSDKKSDPPVRILVDCSTATCPNIRFARNAPTKPPANWTKIYAMKFCREIFLRIKAAPLTTGLKCAPPSGARSSISMYKAKIVEIVFISS
jgi:hypothetical protein